MKKIILMLCVVLASCGGGETLFDDDYVWTQKEKDVPWQPIKQVYGSFVCDTETVYDSIVISTSDTYTEYYRDIQKHKYIDKDSIKIHIDTVYNKVNEGDVHFLPNRIELYEHNTKNGNILYYEDENLLYDSSKTFYYKKTR